MQKNNKLIRFVNSLIILPILTTGPAVSSLPQAGLGVVGAASQTVITQAEGLKMDLQMAVSNIGEASPEEILEHKANLIDAYYKDKGMPLEGYGRKMAEEAEKNGLDWRLLAAISVRESTGGKFKCVKVPNNPFGWGSCKIGFESFDKAIETVGRNLGGNNPKTARYYANKNTIAILEAYNPRTVVATYPEQVVSIMDKIGPEEITSEVAVISNI